MARRPSTPVTRQPANLSPEQIRAAIPKLKRRIEELKAFDIGVIQDHGDPRISALQQKIQATLTEIFGPDSIEYHRDIDAAHLYKSDGIMVFRERYPQEIQQYYQRGIAQSISILETSSQYNQPPETFIYQGGYQGGKFHEVSQDGAPLLPP